MFFKGNTMHRHTKKISTLLTGIAALTMSAAAMANFPDKPVKLIVPFPPGGLADTVARVVADRMSISLGQPIVVDYKAGAATIIGADTVARSAPDGYTLLLGSATTFAVNPIIYSKLSYEPLKSFQPIGIIGSSSLALLANNSVAANNVQDLISDIKANPKKYSYGSHGSGSTVHFAGEMLWRAAGVEVQHIPYKGSAPATTDLMGGQIALTLDSVPAAMAAAKSDRVKVLATTGEQRTQLLPDVPTIAESGYPVTLEAWWAIVAPHGIPAHANERLVAALKDAVSDPAVHERLANLGFDTKYGPPSAYAELIKQDTDKLAPIAKANNIRQD